MITGVNKNDSLEKFYAETSTHHVVMNKSFLIFKYSNNNYQGWQRVILISSITMIAMKTKRTQWRIYYCVPFMTENRDQILALNTKSM